MRALEYLDNPITPHRAQIERFLTRIPNFNLPTPPRSIMARYGGRQPGRRGARGVARRRLFTQSRTATRTRQRSNVGTRATTFQHDASMIYRRKRAPRRVRRRAKRSAANYNHHLVAGLGQKSAVFQALVDRNVVPVTLHDAQDIYTVGMFGGVLGSATWGDLAEIASNEGLFNKTGKIHFKSCVLETQIKNMSENDVLLVDVYEVLARRDGYNEPGDDWGEAMTNQTTISSMSSLTATELGCTPFDAPGFGSSWLIRNKTRYRISPGLSIYLQRRDAKDYKFNTSRFEYDAIAADTRVKMFANMSEGFLIVARNSDVDTATPKGGPIDYKCISTKTYHYAVEAYENDEKGVQ